MLAGLSAVLLRPSLEGLLHLASTPDMLLPNLDCALLAALLDVPGLLLPEKLAMLFELLLSMLRLTELVGEMGRPVRRAFCCSFC